MNKEILMNQLVILQTLMLLVDKPEAKKMLMNQIEFTKAVLRALV